MGNSPKSIGLTAAAAVPEELADVYQLAESDLAKVGEIIFSRLRHTDAVVDEILRYSFRLGGKRLRPLLVILCAKACGEVRREHLLSAAALEMIHTGTLVHDDILDGALFRRHLETINLRWDSQFAVLAGDLLLTRAISLITECGSAELYPIIADACTKTCEGELMQVASSGRLDLSRAEYRRIVEGKTAALIETACRLGALFAKQGEKTASLFAQFGQNIGVAFQIFDDVLDLTGTDDVTGKTLGTDLLNQKLTLPVIHYLETAPDADRESLLALFRKPDFGTAEAALIRARILEGDSVLFALQKANGLVEEAISLLVPYLSDVSPAQREAVLALQSVARFIADRNR